MDLVRQIVLISPGRWPRAGAVIGDLEKYSVAEQMRRAGDTMALPLLSR